MALLALAGTIASCLLLGFGLYVKQAAVTAPQQQLRLYQGMSHIDALIPNLKCPHCGTDLERSEQTRLETLA